MVKELFTTMTAVSFVGFLVAILQLEGNLPYLMAQGWMGSGKIGLVGRALFPIKMVMFSKESGKVVGPLRWAK